MEQSIGMNVGKIYIGITIAASALSMVFAQPVPDPQNGRLEPPLIDFMRTASNSGPVNVILVLRDQATDQQKRDWLKRVNESDPVKIIEQTRKILTHELQELATTSQAQLLSSLRSLERQGTVRDVTPLWLLNAIALKAPVATIQNLATSNEIGHIHLDLPRKILQQSPTNFPKNFVTVGADGLDLSVFTQRVVVAVVDSGVKLDHPNLVRHLWVNKAEDLDHSGTLDTSNTNHRDDDQNGFVDDVMGWNFIDNNNSPNDQEGHGTGVAGVIVGDGSVGLRTGIALNAQIMPLLDMEPGGASWEQHCFEAMQYAVANGANILNFSAGFVDDLKSPPDYAAWRISVGNLVDAGMLFVAAAGNFGNDSGKPAPFQVTTPGRVPAALTVGYALTALVVEENSSKGPVTWTNVAGFGDYPFEVGFAPGLIKPDLVAPGDAIDTLGLITTNAHKTGSSFAAPQVSAAAALLWARHPGLTAYEVRFILEETAHSLEGTTPNASVGWGLLNVKDALQYNLKTAPPFDLSVGQIKANLRSTEPSLFSVTLTNLGNQVVGNSELRFYAADAETRQASDLDLRPNGEPDPAKFQYIGSYFVPILGPSGSRHEGFEGFVSWKIPSLAHKLWMGVIAKAGPTPRSERSLDNNRRVNRVP